MHCVKSVRIRSYSGPYFPVFGLNTERYISSEWGKIRTRISPNTDTFYAVMIMGLYLYVPELQLKMNNIKFYAVV